MTKRPALPDKISSVAELDRLLSEPSPALVEGIGALEGGLLVLGAGGKMGFTLAAMAHRAAEVAGLDLPVVAVSRFSDPVQREPLEKLGIDTIPCDLLDVDALERLPDLPNVVFMAGRKFGSVGNEPLTWAINTFLPGLVARRFRDARIVAFSTGNVYPFVPVDSPGADEDTPPAPVGEYAQSCLGRERIFQHFCLAQGTRTVLIRLNYAIDLRYGVLLDIARAVWAGEPIDLGMSRVNVIWQGDACDWALRAFGLCSVPAAILNVTGPEIVSVRAVAERFGALFGRGPVFQGREQPDALLASSAKACRLFGSPRVPLERMIAWVADWVARGVTYAKPTHFSEREGRF
jgi:nucleoside-diphosphate-sugar epimerase